MLNPLNSEARLAYGHLLLRENRPRDAIVQLEEATRLMPNATAAAYDLTRAYDLAGQPAQAAAARRRFLGLRQVASRVQALEKRASVSPTNFDYPYELGTLELGRGNYRRAYVWLNKAGEALSGLRNEEIRGKDVLQLVPDPWNTRAREEIERCLEEQTPREYNSAFRRKGDSVLVAVTIRLLPLVEDGASIGFLATALPAEKPNPAGAKSRD